MGIQKSLSITVVVAHLATIFPITLPSALAFDGKYHDQSAQEGLGNFLREGVLRDLKVQRLWADETYPPFRGTQDQIHFDDCEFNGSAKFIRDHYRAAISGLADDKLWVASENFGRLLHTVQDFYSHSNWVELFPLHGGKVTQADLVDLGGAHATLAKHWYAPAGGEVVRDDIMLDADDWEPLAKGWTVKRNGGGRLVPTLIDPQGRTRGRLLVTGRGTADDECHVQALVTSSKVKTIYTGIDHETLNKDGPDLSFNVLLAEVKKASPELSVNELIAEISKLREAGIGNWPVELKKLAEVKKLKHERALRLATLQTGYEWCRLVREAGLANRDGLLLALWVKPGKSPHPRETPCAPASPGRAGIVVTIKSIRIRDAQDGEGEAGEIQLAAVLYDNPLNFHRSVHVTNRNGSMSLRAGDLVPRSQLPAPLVLCLSPGQPAVFAVHAWENDDSPDDPHALDFDNLADRHNPQFPNEDDVLVGFKRRLYDRFPSGLQVARSKDMEVRYQVSRKICDQDLDIQ